MRQICTILFFLFSAGLFGQGRDTLITVNGDSTCYLKIPLERSTDYAEIKPVLVCSSAETITLHVWLYDRWGREVYAASSLEDIQKLVRKIPVNDGDFTWRFVLETTDKNQERTTFECTSPLHLTN